MGEGLLEWGHNLYFTSHRHPNFGEGEIFGLYGIIRTKDEGEGVSHKGGSVLSGKFGWMAQGEKKGGEYPKRKKKAPRVFSIGIYIIWNQAHNRHGKKKSICMRSRK